MKNKKERSVGLRAFNAACAIVIVVSVLFILVGGFQVVAAAALVCAIAGVATPAVAGGEGIIEMLMGIFEAILDGIMGIFEAIASIFSGLFG